MIRVRRLAASELHWANERYAEIDFLPSSGADVVAVAEVGSDRAGLGRIVPIGASSGELGGIYVFPEFRNQSVARTIVGYLLEHADQATLYCVPFVHLQQFYEGFGFAPVAETEPVPSAIAAKICHCESLHSAPVRLLAKVGR